MQPEHRKPVRLAAAAYHAAMAKKPKAAAAALQRIWDECGEDGLAQAVLAYCDTFIAHATGQPAGKPIKVKLSFWEGTTGRLDEPGSEHVPAEIQWAGRLIAARAAMDSEAYQAVVNELPEGASAETGKHVAALLQVVVDTVGGLPRGYARMGRGVRADG